MQADGLAASSVGVPRVGTSLGKARAEEGGSRLERLRLKAEGSTGAPFVGGLAFSLELSAFSNSYIRERYSPLEDAMSDRQSRREFMGITAAGVSAAFVGPRFRDVRALIRALGAPPDPDLIVINAKVYTMDPALARA